ncbi:ring finger domain containing protein [Nitzschia inconspicua]|uniref:Ring finger domain containing protein n=1 Tax=Nitzschia inconspicua TaxID=303405 RepID=A0A9K3K5K6_9STRA|nr:ring finger domain containing protein [Nitzschia inconspicua]KAG7338462.1 ring finger domain containing protein [Nitzschia inconspicua]KAG7350745.1 ring finger domain containing protein [Nitzschia inconspicua]
MDNPKYSALRIRRHESLPCTASSSTLRRHATSVLLSSRRLGASKNSPYVGSFRHAPPTTFRSMAASETQHSTVIRTSTLLSPVFSSSTSATVAIPMKNSPYVGWFRHAPPSTRSTSKTRSHLSTLIDRSNSKKQRKDNYIHTVDPDVLMKLDRWHKALTVALLREDRKALDGTKRHFNNTMTRATLSEDLFAYPPFQEIINGRLVGGSGKDRRSRSVGHYCHPNSSTALVDASATTAIAAAASPAINALAKLTSWLLFPLVCEEDDISLCEKSTGLKLLQSGATAKKEDLRDDSCSADSDQEDGRSDDDDSSTSTTSSVSVGDLPDRNPWSQTTGIDAETERELSNMNVSVSEIAEAYYAHQLIDQELLCSSSNNKNNFDCRRLNVGHNRSGLLVTTYTDDALMEGIPSSDHRLDYEITQMDIARMARNASRHLDVDSILNLPTVTYQSRLALPRHKDLAERRQHVRNRPDVCRPARGNKDSSILEDGWSFIMVSGVKSSVVDSSIQQSGARDKCKAEEVCVICLEAFQNGDRLRVLPCDHSFHVGCIDRWLSGSHSYNECFTAGCPTCKKQPSATRSPRDRLSSVATPADEFVVEDELEDEAEDTETTLDGSVPSWAFAKLGSALAMSQGC